jgi:formylglycine-generating enzyme required for sulfatase activity
MVHLGGVVLAIGTIVSVLIGVPGSGSLPEAPEPAWIAHGGLPFSVSATEITVAQFRACVEAGGCDDATTNPACNYGKPGHDAHPVNCVNYHGAEQYCAHVGGRVCTQEEWLAACGGIQGHAYPYGDAVDLAACNVQSQTQTVAGRARGTVPVGSLPQCEGGLAGLFDMAGNVAEWVDSCKDDYCKFRGAGYLSNAPVDIFAGCSGICSGNDRSFKSGVVGIRCCKDDPEASP